jgi:glutamine synthetase
MLERLYSNKQIILKKTQEFFANSSSLIPKIGCELEFFLLKNCGKEPANKAERAWFIEQLASKLGEKFPLIFKIEEEQGASQIEIKTAFTSDLARLGEELEKAKNFAKNLALEKNFIASFAAQPFPEDCGNALQFNISLHDVSQKNLFESDEKFLSKIAAGLLASTNSMMIFLAAEEEDYLRFSLETNRDLFKRGKFTAPVNLSFGNDNRTCAIRVPRKSNKSNYGKRLEYRVAAANAEPFLAISAILLSLIWGIKKEQPELPQIHGNAFDGQYQLKKLCKNLGEAKEAFLREENFIRKSFLNFLPFSI